MKGGRLDTSQMLDVNLNADSNSSVRVHRPAALCQLDLMVSRRYGRILVSVIRGTGAGRDQCQGLF